MANRNRELKGKACWTVLIAIAVPVASALIVVACGGNTSSNGSAKHDVALSAAESLLKDVRAFRVGAGELESQAATKQWFALYDRASKLESQGNSGDMSTFDSAVSGEVGERSLLAALPPPDAWPSFRAEAVRRAAEKKTDRTLGLRYLAEILTGDRVAATATLSALETKENREKIAAARSTFERIYGDEEAQIEAFRNDLKAGPDSYASVLVPDLIGMVGEKRASELLTESMSSGRTLHFDGGEATRALARKIALANVDKMKVPQWSMAGSVDAAALFEAIDHRFPHGKADSKSTMADWGWREAATYYFLAMVRDTQPAKAQATLVELSGRERISIPHEAVEALQRAQLNEPLYRFLGALLTRRPEIDAWDLYLEQAAVTRHSSDALALIDQLLGRKDVDVSLRPALLARRASALLAADRVADASAAFQNLLKTPPAANEPALNTRVLAAGDAAKSGRLLSDPVLANLGLGFLAAAVKLEADARDMKEARKVLYGELRRQNRAEEALKIATENLRRAPTFSEAIARRMGVGSGDGRTDLVEIAGIHSAAGRHKEVLDLLATSTAWGATDLAELLTEKDTQDQLLGVMAARALQASGDKAGALRIARATVAATPSRDAGYELIAELDPSAAATFDELFAGDEFEERPLIWKANVLLAASASQEAEETIRRAIAIDPSDGEEGPNDRMRAYSVLAQILRSKGDSAGAQTYENAVAAIRLSEHGDEFHSAGLYERAFKTYRDALGKFSDAYCIQSRLAVQLSKQGRRQEALEHYRRAYELMPSSFGRVESHCFGCESVFQGAESQTLAERVFTDIVRKSPEKPQAHYLLAYLREQQGRYAEAVQPLRAAVSLDSHYLNAWKRLHDLADKTYLDAGERDIARLKLLELDPLHRHGYYNFDDVGQLAALWNGIERARALADKLAPPVDGVYPLRASAKLKEEGGKESVDMSEFRLQMLYDNTRKGAAAAFYEHALTRDARELMGLGDDFDRFRPMAD